MHEVRDSSARDFPRRLTRLSLLCRVGVAILLLALLAACRSTAPSDKGPEGIDLEGMASWYGPEFAGRPTANGEIFDPQTMTAAHRTLPFGTLVRVTNTRNGRSVVVRINDRGPFIKGRVIDLTPAGARAIGFSGLAPVTLAVVGHS